jgi:exonuclease III
VGILIRSDIFKKELERIDDNNNNNFLLLKVELNSGVWVLGSIYGPNDNDINFFTDLEAGLEKLNNPNMVIGGDWNATWDSRPVNQNYNVINMATIPSKYRSDKIAKIAEKLGLTDPFRVLHPIKKEFTYIPNARMNLNRSRIDFFLIKRDNADLILDCKIAETLASTSFDHKKISLTLGNKKN